MSRARTVTIAAIAFFVALGVANASWYDDYDAGIIAVRKGQWQLAVQKMTSAIGGNAREDNKARTYGAIFINYHPYYYRGVANLNLGKYEQAIADLERTTGPGPENLGSIDMLMQMAKMKLASESTPEPPPTQTVKPPTPTPVNPTPTPTPVQVPQIDPALRARAAAAINTAKQHLTSAQQRKATASPQYQQATSMIADAATKNSTAKSNDDYNTIISIADNAATIADLATAPGVPTPTPVPTRPISAADAVLADYRPLLRNALENYFAGEFETAARGFEDLSRKLPNNGWIYAFLGASQYSVYAFEADEAYKNAALRSFRKAKQLGKFKGGLPEKYFSKRIRKVFRET
ncbi:MAG TPA: hypothetical protein VMU84_14845 [Thermoanaerobaculia bacterium]|nr:hypothetical protein [Thermoanaerobaculia bacterium]